VLIENVHFVAFCIIFSYLVDNQKYWNLTLKLTPIISSVHIDNSLSIIHMKKC